MALRLRFNDKSILLPTGQLLVGRSVECNLVVHDPLASRRHAMITVGQTGAFVTDLGSKAGVIVNGELIKGARKLIAGDEIQIASACIHIDAAASDMGEEPTDPHLRSTQSPPPFAAVPAAFRLAATPSKGLPRVEFSQSLETMDEEDYEQATGSAFSMASTLDVPRSLVAQQLRRQNGPDSAPRSAPRTEARPSQRSEERSGPDSAPRTPRSLPYPVSPTLPRPENLRAVAGMVNKALALGLPDDAERLAQRALLELLEGVRSGEVGGPMMEAAATLAIRLAAGIGAGRWFDYAVELYATRGELMPAQLVDMLLDAVRKAKPINKAAFRSYVEDARIVAGDAPARRFVVQRLEGVQRVLDLK